MIIFLIDIIDSDIIAICMVYLSFCQPNSPNILLIHSWVPLVQHEIYYNA